MLHAPVYGKCKKLTSSTSLLGLSATLKLYSDRSKINLALETSEYQFENIAAQLFMKLRQQLGLVERNCQLPQEELCGNFDKQLIPEMFAIKIRYTTSKDCQEDFIIDRLKLLLKNGINVQFDKKVVSFTTIAFSPFEYDQYCRYVRDQYQVGKETLLPYIDFQSFSSCPSVSLNVDHYKNLMKQARETSQRRDINSLFNLTALDTHVTHKKGKLSVEVCFESYSSVLQKANHGMSYFCMKTTLVVMTLLSFILNIFMTL